MMKKVGDFKVMKLERFSSLPSNNDFIVERNSSDTKKAINMPVGPGR